MATDSVESFDSNKQRDARIRRNTRKLRRHEKLGLIIGGYLLAEGSNLLQDLASILV